MHLSFLHFFAQLHRSLLSSAELYFIVWCTIVYLSIHQNFFIPPKGNFVLIKHLLPKSWSPQPMATAHLLFVSMDLPILAISYKWNLINSLYFPYYSVLISFVVYFQPLLFPRSPRLPCYKHDTVLSFLRKFML